MYVPVLNRGLHGCQFHYKLIPINTNIIMNVATLFTHEHFCLHSFTPMHLLISSYNLEAQTTSWLPRCRGPMKSSNEIKEKTNSFLPSCGSFDFCSLALN